MKASQFFQFLIVLMTVLCISCSEEDTTDQVPPMDWLDRSVNATIATSTKAGSSYLSVYSQIYSRSEERIHDLTATISIRNTSPDDTLYLSKADYHDKNGDLLRNYLTNKIYLLPLETVDIVINQNDASGGTGGNFIFDWQISENSPEPLFEAVMISTYGQQGLSFTTQGIRISNDL